MKSRCFFLIVFVFVFLFTLTLNAFSQERAQAELGNLEKVEASEYAQIESDNTQTGNLLPCTQSHSDDQPNQRGCCSWHGGVCGCDSSSGRVRCCDGTLSPSCRCD